MTERLSTFVQFKPIARCTHLMWRSRFKSLLLVENVFLAKKNYKCSKVSKNKQQLEIFVFRHNRSHHDVRVCGERTRRGRCNHLSKANRNQTCSSLCFALMFVATKIWIIIKWTRRRRRSSKTVSIYGEKCCVFEINCGLNWSKSSIIIGSIMWARFRFIFCSFI